MPKSSKPKNAKDRKPAKSSGHESAAGSDAGNDLASGIAGDIVHATYDQAVEGVRSLAGRSSPEFEGLRDARAQEEDEGSEADLQGKAFKRKFQRAMAAQGKGQPDPAVLNELAAKEAAAKKSAGDATFASVRLDSDQATLDTVEAKIRELNQEHDDYSTLDLGKWVATGSQNAKEQEALEHIKDQLLKKLAQDKDKKLKAADAANIAKEELSNFRDSLVQGLQSPNEGAGRDSSLQQMAGALKQASDADKAVLEALRTFDATAQSIKAYAAAVKQRLDDVNQTLEANTRAIGELYSRLRTNPGGVQQ